jgi:hypothetical protein
MVALLLGLLAGCRGASDVETNSGETDTVDTDTDVVDTDATDTDATDTDPGDTDAGPDAPTDDPAGAWRVAESDRLPEQSPTWESDLVPANFPEITDCLVRIEWVEQGLRFNTDSTITHTMVVGALLCDDAGTATYEIERPYASWLFSRNEGDGSVYIVESAREWLFTLNEPLAYVQEGEKTFNLGRAP